MNHTSFSFPRSAWERTVGTLRVPARQQGQTVARSFDAERRDGCVPTRSVGTRCFLLFVLGLAIFFGCDRGESSRPAAPPPKPPVNVPPPPPPPSESKTQPPAPSPSVSKPPEPVNQKPAGVGVGKRGRGYGQGVVATPAASLWAASERITFEFEISKAMQLFKATEDRGPKDHAEYMEKIIKANHIHLPELPEGDRYMYDPKTEELMVESPKPE